MEMGMARVDGQRTEGRLRGLSLHVPGRHPQRSARDLRRARRPRKTPQGFVKGELEDERFRLDLEGDRWDAKNSAIYCAVAKLPTTLREFG